MTDLEKEMLEIIREQHKAIDILFAALIVSTKDDEVKFYPSESGQPWKAGKKGFEMMKRMEGKG